MSCAQRAFNKSRLIQEEMDLWARKKDKECFDGGESVCVTILSIAPLLFCRWCHSVAFSSSWFSAWAEAVCRQIQSILSSWFKSHCIRDNLGLKSEPVRIKMSEPEGMFYAWLRPLSIPGRFHSCAPVWWLICGIKDITCVQTTTLTTGIGLQRKGQNKNPKCFWFFATFLWNIYFCERFPPKTAEQKVWRWRLSSLLPFQDLVMGLV